jgi:hypothetical protein
MNFFVISFESMNLLSFMLGMTWAFFNQGLFGQKIGKWVFLYWFGMALYYYLAYHGRLGFLEKFSIP